MRAFIDLGAYNGDSIKGAQKHLQSFDEYIGFEPCLRNYLKATNKFITNGKVIIRQKAAGTKNRKVLLNKAKNEIGHSLISTKNNLTNEYEQVQEIDFSDWLQRGFNKRDWITLKIDIEGKEYDLLEDMIEKGTINLIDELYVEWHWQKCKIPEERHWKLVQQLKDLGQRTTGEHNDLFPFNDDILGIGGRIEARIKKQIYLLQNQDKETKCERCSREITMKERIVLIDDKRTIFCPKCWRKYNERTNKKKTNR